MGKYTHTWQDTTGDWDRVTSTPLVYHMLSLGGQKVCKLVEGTSSKMQYVSVWTMYMCVSKGGWEHSPTTGEIVPSDHYRIAENFRGRKLSRISRFCGYLEKFSSWNLGAWHPLAAQASNSRKFFSVKSVFPANLWKFSPSKVCKLVVWYIPVTAWSYTSIPHLFWQMW